MIEWWVIITIGCLSVDMQIEQFGKQVCFLDTKMLEAPVSDKAVAEHIVENFQEELREVLPGSFAIARYEKRKRPEPKEENETTALPVRVPCVTRIVAHSETETCELA